MSPLFLAPLCCMAHSPLAFRCAHCSVTCLFLCVLVRHNKSPIRTAELLLLLLLRHMMHHAKFVFTLCSTKDKVVARTLKGRMD